MIALYALWCGFCWLLRGGKFGVVWRALFKREPGTTVTRIGCAALMAVPLAFVDLAYALLVPFIWFAMTVGYFRESMGLEKPHDLAWLALWGVTVATVMVLPVMALKHSIPVILWAALGSLAAPAYYFNKPFGHRWGLDWTERAELMTGVVFGVALWGAAWL